MKTLKFVTNVLLAAMMLAASTQASAASSEPRSDEPFIRCMHRMPEEMWQDNPIKYDLNSNFIISIWPTQNGKYFYVEEMLTWTGTDWDKGGPQVLKRWTARRDENGSQDVFSADVAENTLSIVKKSGQGINQFSKKWECEYNRQGNLGL